MAARPLQGQSPQAAGPTPGTDGQLPTLPGLKGCPHLSQDTASRVSRSAPDQSAHSGEQAQAFWALGWGPVALTSKTSRWPSGFLPLDGVCCLAGFAVAQCINQHSSPSLSSPSPPSASGSPSGSGNTSHCDSGGSSSTPSAAQSPAGIDYVTQRGRGFGEPLVPRLHCDHRYPVTVSQCLGDAVTQEGTFHGSG